MTKLKQTNTFLVEIVIVILFFSLSVAVTLQLFVSAHANSTLSSEKNIALMRAQSVCEQIREAGPGAPESFEKKIEGCTLTEQNGSVGRYEVCFDKDWNIVNMQSAYLMTIEINSTQEESGLLINAAVSVTKDKNGVAQMLTQLNTSHYLAQS